MNGKSESDSKTEDERPPCLGELSKSPCAFPYVLENVTLNECTNANNGNGRLPGRAWCPLLVDDANLEPEGQPGTHALKEGGLSTPLFSFFARMNHTVLVGSIGAYWDYCGSAESCGDNNTQYLTDWNKYLDPATPGTCAEYEGGMCEAFVPIGSRIFVPGNVNVSDLDSRADRFILSTSSYSFLPASCRFQA
jgi:hypothetical protein